jgi:hypothetical protein
MLAKGWTLGSAQGLRFMQWIIRMNYGPMFRLLQQHWKDTAPDLVVSLIPNFNRVIFDSLLLTVYGRHYRMCRMSA